MYLHTGLFHYLINMFCLIPTGKSLERMHGPFKVAIIYFLSGIFGAAMCGFFIPGRNCIGASGAILGLIGAEVGQLIHNWGLFQKPRSTIVQNAFALVVQLLLGTMPMIDNYT